MRKVSFALLWLYVFTVPWDVVPFAAIGTVTRLVGVLAIVVGLVTTAAWGRFQKPNSIMWLSMAFTAAGVASLLWTMSPEATLVRVWTYVQLLGSVWLFQEFARTRAQQQSLLVAFCLGIFVPAMNQLAEFVSGAHAADLPGRFSSTGIMRLNANDLGLTLVMGIPVAWYLLRSYRGWTRLPAFVYLLIAPPAILLTASRGSFLAGTAAFIVAPIALFRLSVRSLVFGAVVVATVVATSAQLVPDQVWTRLQSIPQEIAGGGSRMSGRVDIWGAGFQLIPEHPVLGIGAGAYADAMDQLLGKANPAHNVLLDVLVEQGILGLTLFTALIAACAWKVYRLPPGERALWAVLGLSWFIGVMSLSWAARKITWMLIGLIAARAPGAGDSQSSAADEATQEREPIASFAGGARAFGKARYRQVV